MGDEEKLYELLPSIYRIRDRENGEQLRALLSVFESELALLRNDIRGLYDNWFIETCEEWAVPYIGDTLGVRGLYPGVPGVFSLRPFIANTLRYRRRKGTVTVLEELAHDLTGWRSKAVEFFRLLPVTQNVNHVRPGNVTVDLRDAEGLELLGGPFETAAHTADVRKISACHGKYDIPNVGIFLWRLQNYPLNMVTACPAGSDPACYFFNPLGIEAPLFNEPWAEEDVTRPVEEADVPGMLRRRPLRRELNARRRAVYENVDPEYGYFGSSTGTGGHNSVFEIYFDDQIVDPVNILICDLDEKNIDRWKALPASFERKYRDGDGSTHAKKWPLKAVVDPVRGKIAIPADGTKPEKIRVRYSYGFGGDLGGGPYDREQSIDSATREGIEHQFGVTRDTSLADGVSIFDSISKALDSVPDDGKAGAIVIMDSGTYDEDLVIDLKGHSLLIAAADWPEEDNPAVPGAKMRSKGEFVAQDKRPLLSGSLRIKNTDIDAGEKKADPGSLMLNGLLIRGPVRITPGSISRVDIVHSTIVPGKDSITVDQPDGAIRARLALSLSRSVCGTVQCPQPDKDSEQTSVVGELDMTDSIIDGDVKASGTLVKANESTIFGETNAGVLVASNSIFQGKVTADRKQTGCIRFSYLPYYSTTPRRFRCQPDLALAKRLEDKRKSAGGSIGGLSRDEKNMIISRTAPIFTSARYGDPGYGQLSQACPDEIFAGADDGSEMGAFNFLKQAHRIANLRSMLDEYMRFGLDAGIFYVD